MRRQPCRGVFDQPSLIKPCVRFSRTRLSESSTMNPSDSRYGPPRFRSPLYAAVDAPPASPHRASSTGLLIFRNMPSLLPRKINRTASVIKARVHRPSPCVHWVGIFEEFNEATCRFTCVTACCFANWELTIPCCQDAAPLNYRTNGQFPGRDFNPLE